MMVIMPLKILPHNIHIYIGERIGRRRDAYFDKNFTKF